MLSETEILQAKTRALNVINGFIRIRNQQAADVVSLAEALQEANQIIACVRLHEQEKKNRPLPESFDEIFGSLMRGA